MKLKNLTKKLTTLAITALMATTLVSTQNVLAASKKAQKKANKAYAQAIKKNKVAKFTSYSLIEVTGGGTKELVTVNLNSNAEGKARNLNIYTYNKGKVKKIWSTSDQIIAYNKKQKTIAGLQYSVLSENGSEREKYYIYKYDGKKVGKNAIKAIYKKATIKVPKKQYKKYKKLFSKKTGFKKSMKIKK